MPLALRVPLLLALLLIACPEPEQPPAQPTPASKAEHKDALAALGARRTGSAGESLEAEAAAERHKSAVQAVATRDGEPLPEDREEAAPRRSAPPPDEWGELVGETAPSDLDRADDEPEEENGWVDMDLVAKAVRARQKSFQTCWERAGGDSGRRLELRITLSGSRRLLSAARAGSSDVSNPDLVECTIAALNSVRWPEVRGREVTFVYPVRF